MEITTLFNKELFDFSNTMLKELYDRHPYSHRHSLTVERLAILFAIEVAPSWSVRETIDFAVGARLHDIGKLDVDIKILDKPGRLNSEEFDEIKLHPIHGVDRIRASGLSIPRITLDAILHHHEYFGHGGSGYPHGIRGEDIPLAGRILAVADVFDALTTTRNYKSAYSVGEAMNILQNLAGNQLDPILVNMFIRHIIIQAT